MLEDLLDGNEDAASESVSRPVAFDHDKMQQAVSSDRNFSVSCELGVCYPVLKAVLNREDMHMSLNREDMRTARTCIQFMCQCKQIKYVMAIVVPRAFMNPRPWMSCC